MTTKIYDVYGSKTMGLEQLRSAIEAVAGVNFERHESSYLGGDYFRAGDPRAEEFVIHANFVDEDGEFAEAEHPEYCSILEINASPRADQLRVSLAGLVDVHFLRRDEC